MEKDDWYSGKDHLIWVYKEILDEEGVSFLFLINFSMDEIYLIFKMSVGGNKSFVKYLCFILTPVTLIIN